MNHPVGYRVALGAGAFVLLLGLLLVRLPHLAVIALEGYDDLFQLALGLKASHGAWPGIDFFTNYGPGVSALSALSWLWNNAIVAEVTTGTGLLALGLFAFWRAGLAPGLPGHNLFLLLLLAFLAPGWAKYYFVIWPGLFLLVLGDPCAERSPRAERFRWLLLGGIAGIGGWFRLEVGLALSAALAGAFVLRWKVGRRDPSLSVLAGCAIAGAMIPWLLYFAAAWIGRGRFAGPADLVDFYFASTVAKAVDFRWVSALPRRVGFFGPDSLGGCFGLGLVATSLVMVAWFFPRRAAGKVGQTSLGRRAWCAAWLTLCLFPQALHRFDLMHILQVAAPGLVAVSLGLAAWREAAEMRAPRLNLWCRVGAPTALAMLVVLAGRIHVKTAPPLTGTIARLGSLTAGLEGLDPTSPDLRLAAFARARTTDEATILVPSIDTRFYVLVGRPFAGLFPHWAFRLPERWQERQIAALSAQRASLVLHADYYRGPDVADYLRPLDFLDRNPRIDAFIAKAYPVTILETPQWRVLAPDAAP